MTGSSGFLGRAVVQALHLRGYDIIEFPALNLMNESATEQAIAMLPLNTPLIHLAYPGGDGIGDAAAHPATIAMNLMRMDLNVIQACARQHVPKLVCIGSVCSYPEVTPVPTTEDMLWNGYPEDVNASYGIVKRTQLALLQACRREFKLNGIHLILPNLYGPGDKTQHVVPALIRKIRKARLHGTSWCVWGAPHVTRSFLFIEDAAAGIVRALERYDHPRPLNLVNRGETSMASLVLELGELFEYRGHAVFDSSKPAGHERRHFSQDAMIAALGWQPSTSFSEGLRATVAWHCNTFPIEA